MREGALMPSEARRSVPAEQPATQAWQLETRARVEFKDITEQLQRMIESSGVRDGFCIVYTPHTTAGILINENDDPSLQKDLAAFLGRLAPANVEYFHRDGNCDAHLKAAMVGCSKTLLIENGRLLLGRWQGVFFCEFDGPRRRDLRVKIVSG
jgi:secondary thiamine-phosphate synthase enzyme